MVSHNKIYLGSHARLQRYVLFVWLAFGLWLAVPLGAEPVRNRILTDVTFNVDEQGFTVDVAFSLPVRYLRQFPPEQGETLQIRLGPLAISDVDAGLLRTRESARIPRDLALPLLDLSYEGDLPGGPYLTLRFTEPMRFTVQQGVDFRSLTISVERIGDSAD
jgi:hypothetical protein